MTLNLEKLIECESGGCLKYVASTSCGHIVENKTHKKQNLIYIGTDFSEISKKISQGWQIIPGKTLWILRAPEYAIVDLSEYQVNCPRNPEEILVLYRLLKKVGVRAPLKSALTKVSYQGLEVVPLRGDSLQAEIRIAGSDRRAGQLSKIIFRYLQKQPFWQKELKHIHQLMRPRKFEITHRLVKNCKKRTRNFAKSVRGQYSSLDQKIDTSIAVGGFWTNLPDLIQNNMMVFILKSSLKYALGFVEDTGKEKQVILWEYHLGNESGKEIILAQYDFNNSPITIFDRSYSGKTLVDLSVKITRLGGRSHRVALFPKSYYGVKNSEFVLFLDRFINSNLIKTNRDWAEKLFIQVINDTIGSP